MKKILLALTLSLALAGCAALQKFEQNVQTVVSGATSPQTVIIAANTFNALEATATNYLNLKKCSPVSGPICRDPKATAEIVPAVRAARVLRDDLIKFMRLHPGEAIPVTLYDALTSAIGTIQRIITQYNIGVVASK